MCTERAEQSGKWGFQGVEQRVWGRDWMKDTGGKGGGEEMGGDRYKGAGHLGVSGVFWRCPRLPLWQPVLGGAILPVG